MDVTRGPEVTRHELGFLGLMEADGTRYEVLMIPFKEYLGCGFISMSGPAYLVVDGGEKTAYAFRTPPTWDYVGEKLIRSWRSGYGRTDAKNTAHLIGYVMQAARDYEEHEAEAEARPAYEELEREAYEEGVLYHFGEGRLEAEDAEAKAQAEKAYDEAIAQAEKAYDEATAQARAAYEEAKAPAWKAYKEAKAQAEKAYDEAKAPAWKAYDEAEAQAEKAYDEATAPAWKAHKEAVAQARAAYKEAIAQAQEEEDEEE